MAQTTSSGSSPTLPPEALEAITTRPVDAPRRCFICLMDQEPSDPPSSWVDPCPCTLEAHQDCMLAWVLDCERSSKPLKCPVCKSSIKLEGSWNPLVALNDAIGRRFTRLSPFLLFGGVAMGVQAGAQLYGAVSMWMFCGGDALMDFLGRPRVGFHGHGIRDMALTHVGNAAMLTNVAPILLIGQLLPNLGNKIFVPTASLYGIYHVMHNGNFVTWPPSPQLALAVFPYIRSIYYNIWVDFVLPYELNLNRQLSGLPPIDPANDNQPGNQQNGQGGLFGFLQRVIDALAPPNEDDEVAQQAELMRGLMADEEVQDPEGLLARHGHRQRERRAPVLEFVIEAGPVEQADERVENAEQDPAPGGAGQGPAAPPERANVGMLLSQASNAIVSALMLPAISFAMGEMIRHVLPIPWITPVSKWYPKQRPGLLQHQWGRSLVGGCLYVVLKDALRLYTKHRKVVAMNNRRVKNVERNRRER